MDRHTHCHQTPTFVLKTPDVVAVAWFPSEKLDLAYVLGLTLLELF